MKFEDLKIGMKVYHKFYSKLNGFGTIDKIEIDKKRFLIKWVDDSHKPGEFDLTGYYEYDLPPPVGDGKSGLDFKCEQFNLDIKELLK